MRVALDPLYQELVDAGFKEVDLGDAISIELDLELKIAEGGPGKIAIVTGEGNQIDLLIRDEEMHCHQVLVFKDVEATVKAALMFKLIYESVQENSGLFE